jgi:hypothetical protein
MPTYQADSVTEICGGRGNLVKDLEGILEQCCELIFVSSELAEGLCLILNNLNDGFNGIAAVELYRKRMVEEIYPGLFFVFLQGGLK